MWGFGSLRSINGSWDFFVDIFQDQIKMSDYANKRLGSEPVLLSLPNLVEHFTVK